MNAGLIAAYDAVEIFASATADYAFSDAGNGLNFNAGLTTYWCPNAIEKDPFVEIAWRGSVAVTTGVVSGEVVVSIPPIGIGPITVGAAELIAAASVSVLLADFRLYQQSAKWLATWSSLNVTIGAAVHAFAGGSIVGPRLTPTGIPFLGIPPTLAAAIAPSARQLAGLIPGSTTIFARSYSGSGSCSGGYHVKEVGAGGFAAFPVSLDVLLGGVTGCPCEPGLLPSVGAGNTASGSVTSAFNQTETCVYRGRIACALCPDGSTAPIPSETDVWDTTAEEETCSSSVTLLPNLPKSVRRLGPDYVALIFRGGLPRTTAVYADICFDYVADVNSGNVQVQTNPHPRESAFLATVTNAPHVVESPFGYPSLAPYAWSAEKLFAKVTAVVEVQPGICPLAGGGQTSPALCFPMYRVACAGNRDSGFPGAVDDAVANPELTPGLYHGDRMARYVDYWSAPQWNYAYWFPPDVADGPLQPFEWPVDNARANPSGYWLPARTQWVWNPKLPAPEATKRRTDLISAPLSAGGLAGYWSGFF